MLPRNCLFPELRMSVPTRVRAKSKGYSTAKDTAPDDAPESNDHPRYRQKSSMGTPCRYKDRNLCETRENKKISAARRDKKKAELPKGSGILCFLKPAGFKQKTGVWCVVEADTSCLVLLRGARDIDSTVRSLF